MSPILSLLLTLVDSLRFAGTHLLVDYMILLRRRSLHTSRTLLSYSQTDFNGAGFSSSGIDNGTPPGGPLSDDAQVNLMSPRALKGYLDQYVIGQQIPKRTLSTAIYNHYLRVQHCVSQQTEHDELLRASTGMEHPVETDYPGQREGISQAPPPPPTSRTNASLNMRGMKKKWRSQDLQTIVEKSNILMHGPTGTGKTLLAKTLAKFLNVPFSISDCTPFTQSGYVGDDVEVSIHRLLQSCDWDVTRAETGIVCLDEVDKLARRPDGSGSGKDVSGEGVQQALLKILEGTTLHISSKADRRAGLPGMNGVGGGNKNEVITIDTSNILFILTGAFIGLDKVVQDRLAKSSIGFNVPINSDFTPFFTQNGHPTTAGALVEPTDLISYGFIPELIGRIPIVTNVDPLSEDDLYRVITEPRNALLRQYEQLFAFSGVELHFTTAALRQVAKQASKKSTGARGLRGVMERLLQDAMFESPGSSIRYVLITEDVVKGDCPAFYLSRGQAGRFHAMISAEEDASKDIEQEDQQASSIP